jgi:hypothetical protein
MASKLAQRLQERIWARAIQKCSGLEYLLDILPLEQSEYVVFLKTESLLSYKISERLRTRSPQDALSSLLATAKAGYCRICFETMGKHGFGCPNDLGLL